MDGEACGLPHNLMQGAACLITCLITLFPDGRTSMEIMKGRLANSRVAECGETILFNILKTKHNPGTFEDQWDAGVYLGFDMRSTESLIRTPVGVFRVADIRH